MVMRRCPEWTDHNVSDPGVTLIETFAFMTDQVRPANLGKAAGGLDRMASALAGCGCRTR